MLIQCLFPLTKDVELFLKWSLDLSCLICVLTMCSTNAEGQKHSQHYQ